MAFQYSIISFQNNTDKVKNLDEILNIYTEVEDLNAQYIRAYMNIKGIEFIYSMCTCKSFLLPISVEGQSHATAVAQCQGHSQAGKVYLCP